MKVLASNLVKNGTVGCDNRDGLLTSSSLLPRKIAMTRNIKIATASDANRTVNTITQAFSADPAARWLYPEARQYVEHFPSFIKAFAGAAFEHGSADCVDDFSGAALWLPPGIYPDEKALVSLLQQTICERDQADALAVLQQMDRFHPDDPHWYLPVIGVEPPSQGKGYGSALLQYGLDRCDRQRKLAYLESSNSKNITLYERHGFEPLGMIQVGSSPPLFPMLRKPRPW